MTTRPVGARSLYRPEAVERERPAGGAGLRQSIKACRLERVHFPPARCRGIILCGCSALVFWRKFVEQRFRVFQIGGVEAFGEPVVDFGEYRARPAATTLLCEQAGETHTNVPLTSRQRFAARTKLSTVQDLEKKRAGRDATGLVRVQLNAGAVHSAALAPSVAAPRIRKPVARQHPVHGITRDAEQVGGAMAVAVGRVERPEQRFLRGGTDRAVKGKFGRPLAIGAHISRFVVFNRLRSLVRGGFRGVVEHAIGEFGKGDAVGVGEQY